MIDGDAVVALLDDPAVHELDRPDVEASGGLAGDQHLVLAPDLPGQDDLLLVAARERARRGGGRSGADVELLDQRGRVGADRGQLQVDAGGERRPVVGVEDEVLGDRERADEPVLPAVLGDVGDARAQPCPRRRAGEVAAVQRDRAGRRGPQAHQRLAQLGLPVALDARDAQDLPRPDLEGQPVHGQPLLARRRSGRRRRARPRRAGPAPCSPAAARHGRPSGRPGRPRWRAACAGRRPCPGAAR